MQSRAMHGLLDRAFCERGLEPIQQIENAGQNKKTPLFKKWCSIKNDYRTLVGLEDANVVNLYVEIDEDEDDE